MRTGGFDGVEEGRGLGGSFVGISEASPTSEWGLLSRVEIGILEW
jgi:hypothetical protein